MKIEEVYPMRYTDEILIICSPKIQFAVDYLLCIWSIIHCQTPDSQPDHDFVSKKF